MIEKLLARIARRSRPGALPAPISVLAAGSHGAISLYSSGGAHDPFSMPYPASKRVRSARSGLTQPGTSDAWLQACDAYVNQRLSGGQIADQPAFFAYWGAAHMAVAQMLWAERDQLHMGLAHIHSGDALLAVVQPSHRQVSLNAQAYQSKAALSLHQLPVGQGEGLDLKTQGKEFVSHGLHSLLWFYGQVYSGAPDLLPPEMGTQLIQLRRFPPVVPAALEMRHLALIHVFSGGALSFAQLQKQVAPDHASSLCADLASFYFTGSLRLLP